MFKDMSARCKACETEPASGKVAITAEHYAEAEGATREEKRKDLGNKAALGCCAGSGCNRAEYKIETKMENGQEVEYMVATCGNDPNSLRGDLIDS